MDIDSDELQELLCEREITRILHHYCQGVDRRDWDLVRSCYHDDASDSHGNYCGGPVGLLEWLISRHEWVRSSSHLLSNITMRFDEARKLARVESYFLSLQIVDGASDDPYAGSGGSDMATRVLGRYVDTFAHRSGSGWRILRRDCVHDWVMRRPVDDAFISIDSGWGRQRRDSSDLLYAPWPSSAVDDAEVESTDDFLGAMSSKRFENQLSISRS